MRVWLVCEGKELRGTFAYVVCRQLVRDGSDRLDEALPDGGEGSVHVGGSNVEIGDEETAFGVETVDGSLDEGVEGVLSAIFGGGVVGVDVVKDVAALEWCSGVVRSCSLFVFRIAVKRRGLEGKMICVSKRRSNQGEMYEVRGMSGLT